MSRENVWIKIPRKTIEKEVEKVVREYTKKLVSYEYVKNVFYNELRKFAKSKVKL